MHVKAEFNLGFIRSKKFWTQSVISQSQARVAPKYRPVLRLIQICFEGYTTGLAFQLGTQRSCHGQNLLLVWGKRKYIKPEVNKKVTSLAWEKAQDLRVWAT